MGFSQIKFKKIGLKCPTSKNHGSKPGFHFVKNKKDLDSVKK